MKYIIGKTDEEDLMEIGFEVSIQKPLSVRIDTYFIKTYKPVMDNQPYRIFKSWKDCKRLCRENLPDWLGYGD